MDASRREFLTGAGRVVIALPAGWAFLQTACGGDGPEEEGIDACTGAGRVTVGATAITVTSSCVGEHLHTITVQKADLAAPPAGGASLESSVTLDHQHVIALSADQLAQIDDGVTVTVTSSLANDHSHVFVIRATAQGGTDDPGGGGYDY